MSNFLNKYISEYSRLFHESASIIAELSSIKDILLSASEHGNKAIIIGNGASAAIASHVAVDLTKNAGVRCINFNESGIITCFANDYGYEHWVENALNYYGDKGDVLIAISSSGASMNIINGCHAARKKEFSKVITLSGMDVDNPLKDMGDINLWVNSNEYNHIENLHQFWLLAVVELIINSKNEK